MKIWILPITLIAVAVVVSMLGFFEPRNIVASGCQSELIVNQHDSTQGCDVEFEIMHFPDQGLFKTTIWSKERPSKEVISNLAR